MHSEHSLISQANIRVFSIPGSATFHTFCYRLNAHDMQDLKWQFDARSFWLGRSPSVNSFRPPRVWLLICALLGGILLVSQIHFTPSKKHHQTIPNLVWQVYMDPTGAPENFYPMMHSWQELNPEHHYTLLDQQSVDSMRDELVKDYPHIYAALSHSTLLVFRSDVLRYALLAMYGGVYADIDVNARKPISSWIPPHLADKARVVVGIEYDALNGTSEFPHSVTFCQWTMMTAPNHEIMWSAASTSAYAVLDHKDRLRYKDLGPVNTGMPFRTLVVETTGPIQFTNVVLGYLRKHYDPTLTYGNFSGITEPTLFHDVLILPINAFGTGQEHSGSIREGSPDALIQHTWAGSWVHFDDSVEW